MPHHDKKSKSPSQKTLKSHNPFPFLEEKAREASIAPFSIFAELFSMRFSKHRMLESTMEILQQFYIAIKDPVEEFILFPGNQYKLSVKCKRCHKCASSPNQGIIETLSSAPSTMLRHWNNISTHEDSTKKVCYQPLFLFFFHRRMLTSILKTKLSPPWIKTATS